MSETYKLLIEQKGINHVNIFKSAGDAYVNDWNIPLKGDDEPIVFSEFYTENQFIVMNWDGWIRIYDADKKELLLDHKLNAEVDAKAVLSIDRSILYVAFSADSGQKLLQLSLDSFQLKTTALPDIFSRSLQIRKDGCLLFYKHDWSYINDQKVYKHFYSVLNMETKTMNQYELPYAPQFSFDEFTPVLDTVKNIGILPAYDDVTYKGTASGEIRFEFRIFLFNLTNFEPLHVLSVRDFPAYQLACSAYECEEMAELFLSSIRNKAYINALRAYYENLTSIYVTPDAIWLCWRGGILRKINSEFILSPLLVTANRAENSEEGMFNHTYFHAHVYHVNRSSIILAEDINFYKTSMPDIAYSDIEKPIPLTFEKTSLEEIYNLKYSAEQKSEIENQDYILIEVIDLSTKQGIEEALLQMNVLVSDLKALGVGSLLLFLLKDSNGKTVNEPAFFAEAVHHNPELVEAIIKHFIAYPKAKYLYRNAEETALCHAVHELAKKGDLYLTTILQYLDTIDMDHDVFNKEYVFPVLEELYTNTVLIKKMKVVSKDLTEWYKYYCEA
jgi:hypothetical protein